MVEEKNIKVPEVSMMDVGELKEQITGDGSRVGQEWKNISQWR